MTVRTAILGAALLAASACTPTAVAHDPPKAASAIDVGLTDFAITTSGDRFVDGEVTLQVTNAGATAHDLRVVGDAVDQMTAVLRPGESAVIRIDARGESTIRLWCTLPGHRRQGMETTIVDAAPWLTRSSSSKMSRRSATSSAGTCNARRSAC